MIKNNLSPLDQWTSLNKVLNLYKIIGIVLGIICFSLTILSFYLATNPPIVVVHDGDQKKFYYPKKKEIEISESDIAAFIVEYVNLRYTWKDLDPTVILRNISPVTTKGLLRKIEKKIRKESGKKKSNKKIEQTIANIRPLVTQNQSSASFDRIVRVDGIPLMASTQVSFRIVRGSPTAWNPIGLYVDGITMHETR